jgi:hypothetical protein
MDLSNLKSSLFGYNKLAVSNYVSGLEKESNQKVQDLQKAANAAIAGVTMGETTTTATQPVSIFLNPGKTWIGWASSNHEGKLKVS